MWKVELESEDKIVLLFFLTGLTELPEVKRPWKAGVGKIVQAQSIVLKEA